jgi:NAD(P)H-hydrate repair Nnr-like enzyme with NAD(P)H-hydrate dehydratase domain
MANTQWLSLEQANQIHDKLTWSKPTSALSSGKLAIVGGSSSGFVEIGKAYTDASNAGAGTIRIILPDNLSKQVPTQGLFEVYFAPSNPYGSFKKLAVELLVEQASWSDMTLFAGGIGRNSETPIVLETVLIKNQGWAAVTGDCLDAFIHTPSVIFDRKQSLVVAKLGQLQAIWPKLYKDLPPPTHQLPLKKVSELLFEAGKRSETIIITNYAETVIATDGQHVFTLKQKDKIWALKTATYTAVSIMQNLTQPFEACISALMDIGNPKS